jgi:hypothetical protein
MYVSPNFKTKKALKAAVANGDEVTIFQVGPFGGNEATNGWVHGIEGPHYPKPHTWYGSVELVNGQVIGVK